MKTTAARRLNFPPPGPGSTVPPLKVCFLPPAMPGWPWEATMITAANCYLLWSFTWLQFVTSLSTFSYQGKNLGFYTVDADPFGVSLPELFASFSVALALFALVGVIGRTRQTPRLWKRIVAVSVFATITIGFSFTVLHLRHYAYGQALALRAALQERYHRNLVVNYDSKDESTVFWLEWESQSLEEQTEWIRRYEKNYRLLPGIPSPHAR